MECFLVLLLLIHGSLADTAGFDTLLNGVPGSRAAVGGWGGTSAVSPAPTAAPTAAPTTPALTTTPAVPPSQFHIFPPSYLPAVSKNVQMTCRPPTNAQGVKVLLMEVAKVESGAAVPLVTASSGSGAIVESRGAQYRATGNVRFNADPALSSLTVDLPNPVVDIAGDYMCVVTTMDAQGLLHRYSATQTLTSLGAGGVVPEFYRTVLMELRADLDNMTTSLAALADVQRDLETNWGARTQAKLASVDTQENAINALMSEVNKDLSDADNKEQALRTELARLRDITPDEKVYFYAFYSGHYLGVSNNGRIPFNSVSLKVPSSVYSTSGYFTCPRNGTYFFRTGISTDGGAHTYATLRAANEDVASLYVYDDYGNQVSSMATAVVRLVEGNRVEVVQTSGSSRNIYGYHQSVSSSYNMISYFMGMLLW